MPVDNSMLSTIAMLALMGVAFWFLLIRPQQKKQKEAQAMVSKLGPGSRVMTTAGVFATVRHVGEKQAIVEIAPGVEMTIVKQAILRIVDGAEEEFEYEDADGAGDDEVPLAADPVEVHADPQDEPTSDDAKNQPSA